MTIPNEIRPALRDELDALARGERPALLTWVENYGHGGAELIRQPEEIWSHPASELQHGSNGSAWGCVPLWTTEESPSDLTAEFEVSSTGKVALTDVRVL
ncbi:hypothetical protein GCM10009623_36630 [Nocardioides aestuarii]|uniref:DUF7668 domain-containing protein n=1 Tax=Nocardioides aestuarii TaxID=252231 RepID=A0ABW4TVB8_9ACTN